MLVACISFFFLTVFSKGVFLRGSKSPNCKVKGRDSINFLPNDKTLDVTKLKAFADDKINVAQMIFFVFDRVENIAGKGENAGYQHFLLFSQCFQKASFMGSLRVEIVWFLQTISV